MTASREPTDSPLEEEITANETTQSKKGGGPDEDDEAGGPKSALGIRKKRS